MSLEQQINNDQQEQIFQHITQSIQQINEELTKFSQKPQLIAVSKTKPISYIKTAYETTKQTYFGENYILELFDKVHSEELKSLPINWFLIGHIQTNKISKITKIVNEGFNLTIQSIDSEEVAQKINKNIQKCIDIMIEIHISDEESKTGVQLQDLQKLIDFVNNECSNLNLIGFMTIGDPNKAEETFQKMSQIRKQYGHQCKPSINDKQEYDKNKNYCKLSMGMSHDYLLAAKYGADFVRVGSNIFGARDYSQKANKNVEDKQ